MRRRSAPLAAVALALTVALSGCGDGGGDAVSAGSAGDVTIDGTRPELERDAPEPAEGATGFYVPGEMPEGWSIRFEQITNPWRDLCPCETAMWRGPGDSGLSTYTSQSPEEPEVPEFEGNTSTYRDIDGGYLEIAGDEVSARWFDGELNHSIYAEGLDPDAVEALARGWTGNSPLAAPEGFELIWAGTTPEIVRRTEFFWRIEDDTGRSMIVHVEPWMFDVPFDYSAYPGYEPVELPENGLTLSQTPGWDETHLEGLWPGGALLSVAASYGEINHSADPLSREEMLEVAGGFRPVSAETWADYIEQQYGPDAIDACRPLLLKPTLADLLVQPGDEGAELDRELFELNDDCSVPTTVGG